MGVRISKHVPAGILALERLTLTQTGPVGMASVCRRLSACSCDGGTRGGISPATTTRLLGTAAKKVAPAHAVGSRSPSPSAARGPNPPGSDLDATLNLR